MRNLNPVMQATDRQAPQLSPDADGEPDLGWLDSRIAQHLSNLRDAIRPTYAIHRRIIIGGTTAVGVTTMLPLVTVPRGRMYNVLAVTVVGVDPFTAAAQPAALCVGKAQLDPITNLPTTADVVLSNLTAPATYDWNVGSLWVHSGLDIYAIHKLGAAINVTWQLFIDDWPENEQAPNAL